MEHNSIPRRRRPGVTPRLLPAWLAITVAGAVAIAGAIGVFLLLTSLLNVPHHISNDTKDAIEQRKLLIDAFKAALALAAGLGAVVALALNYRRHRIEESQSHRDDQRLFTDRFQSAAEQLGHDQPAVRLAGVHAMARLADDRQTQTVSSVRRAADGQHVVIRTRSVMTAPGIRPVTLAVDNPYVFADDGTLRSAPGLGTAAGLRVRYHGFQVFPSVPDLRRGRSARSTVAMSL